MLSHEIIRPLTEMFDTDQQYFRLANGDVIRADFRQAGLNTDAMPGTVEISTVDPKIMPSAATTAIQPWDKARPNIRAAIQKWVQDGAKNTAPTAEGEEPKTIWAGGLTIQGPHSDAMASHLDLDDELDENLHKWFKEKWVRFGPDGKIRGDCARGSDSEGKPKCLPQAKAHALGKKGRASAAARKRRQDPDADRSGPAKNVATKKKTTEQLCPECGGAMWPETMINEKKDACYYKVKSRYKVWPSAYASGALVRCRKKGAKNWGTKSESVEDQLDEKWSTKYKRSINCNNPKGFSQRAHCQGRKKHNEDAEQSVEEGWKSALAGATLAGSMALGSAGPARAADLSAMSTSYLQQVASGQHARPLVSVDDAKQELQQREQGKSQAVPATKPSSARTGYSQSYLQSVVDGTHSRPMISVEKARELLQQQYGVNENQGVAEMDASLYSNTAKKKGTQAGKLAAKTGQEQKCPYTERTTSHYHWTEAYNKAKKQGVAEGERFPEPLTGYHIVYRKTGNVVHGTPSFETRDQAQKYLMTKMFANHQDFEVAHTAGVKEAKRQPETFGGYDPDDFQEKLQRLKTLAGAGPLKTVYDPKQRVYKNIPTAVQPARQPKK